MPKTPTEGSKQLYCAVTLVRQACDNIEKELLRDDVTDLYKVETFIEGLAFAWVNATAHVQDVIRMCDKGRKVT